MTLHDPGNPRPKAYSYVRFSTPEQAKGHSFQRQIEKAAEYAARKGLDLDDKFTFHDLGISGYRGDNLTTGKLGYFKEAVQSGEVPAGSYLLVENLDRISRQNARRAQRVLEDIADLGVTVVTLNDEREYSRESMERDPIELIMSILQFMRANEESATKAHRLKKAWAAKRDAATAKPMTSIVPAWIELDRASGELRLIPERAAIVERIFRDTLAGVGQHQIAMNLNREGVDTWGTGKRKGKFWQRSYIAKVLENEAVIGTFQPHTLEYIAGKRTREAQGRVEGYFPAAITPELWSDVQAFRDGKHSRARGRHAAAPVTNMLAGMAVCPLCGATMTRTNKGARSRPAYVCVRAKGKAGCRYRSVRVSLVEDAIISRLPARLRDAPAGERDDRLDQELADAHGALDAVRDAIDTLLIAIERGGDSKALVERLREREAEFDAARALVRELEGRRAAVAGATVHSRIAKLLEALEPEVGQPDPGAVNLALQSVFRRAIIDYRSGVLIFAWLHGGDMEVPFSSPENLLAVDG